MNALNSHLISRNSTIIQAMQKLNEIPLTLTLFVVDEERKLIGTLTDGDIRRGFLDGLNLDDLVTAVMSSNYQAMKSCSKIIDFQSARVQGIRLLPVLDAGNHVIKIIDLKRIRSVLPLECMIMAGGRGERLRPLTDKTPKPMLPINGKPILEHNIDRLISYGIEIIYISVKYLGQQIIDYFGDGSKKGIRIEYVWEDSPLGTAGALSLVKDFKTEHILLMNSDLFTDADFEDLYLNVVNKNADMGVASVPHTTKIPYGLFFEKDLYVNGFREKPEFINYANAGIYIFKKELLGIIPRNSYYDMTDMMNHLISNKMKLIHNPLVGYWIDIGQPQDYSRAQEISKHIVQPHLQ